MRIRLSKPAISVFKYFIFLFVTIILTCYADRNNPLDPNGTNPKPAKVTVQPKSSTVKEGQSVSFSVKAEGAGDLNYQWQKNGVDISGASLSSYKILSADFCGNDETLRCIINNISGIDTSKPAILTVKCNPPVIVTHPKSISVYVGDSVSFTLTVTGGALQYQWQKNGTDIPGANSSNYTIKNLSMANDGEMYRCVVFNGGADTAISNDAILHVTGNINTEPFIVFPGYGIDSINLSMNRSQIEMIATKIESTNVFEYAFQACTLYVAYNENTSLEIFYLSNVITEQNVTIGSDYDNVISAYGSPDTISSSNDIKTLTYNKIGFDFTFFNNDNKVAVITVRKPILPIYTISYDGNGNTGGSVPESQTKTQCVPITLMKNTGDLVKTGFTFTGWNTAQDGNGTDYEIMASYTIDDNVKLYAKWIAATFELTITSNSATGGTTVPSGTVIINKDETQTITATPSPGYAFKNWITSGGALISDLEANTTKVSISGDASVKAIFERSNYTIHVISISSTEGGTTDYSGIYSYNAVFENQPFNTIVATPSSGYVFKKWEVTCSHKANGTSLTFSVSSPDVIIKAIFERQQ